ncbi:c-type cytochrome biogenesis protein CcmI [Thioclava sp. GXIMD4216]|uniref:c-type cytochrome biogenesis protein CcmI n=1 Tax=Thioclava sp. GXIMD4216 TaxID=3131929 RepID=UPI0030D425BF
MLFWILIAVILVLVALIFLLPLWRQRDEADESDTTERHDMQVYRDQLAEVDRDLARGILSPDEAERARIEISRKLLEADRAARAASAPPRAPKAARLAISVVILACLGGAAGLYLDLGADGYADQPINARLALADQSYLGRPHQDQAEADFAKKYRKPQVDAQFSALMDRLRDAVAARPNDPAGLRLLARNEINVGNLHAGVAAQEKLIAVLGDKATAEDAASLGEYRVIAAGGLVTPEAEAAFGKAVTLDKSNGRARYYIGLMMAQNGRPDRTFRIWDALLRDSTRQDDWVQPVLDNMPTVAWLAGQPDYQPPELGTLGPSLADLIAAEKLPQDQRATALSDKVNALQTQLANRGGSAEDWATLLAGLRLLDQSEQVTAILSEARGVFAKAPEALTLLDQAAEGKWPFDVAAAGQTGPSAEDVRNAQDMTPEDRQKMIQGMVDGLVERLETEGGDASEWDRGLRALMTLNQTDRAADLYAKAQTALADDPAALAHITATAKQIGLAQ